LYDKIATEEDVKTTDELIKFLKEKGHPIVKKTEEEVVEEVEEEKEEVKATEEEKEGIEVGELITKLAKEGGIQIIMKNVKIVINLNVKR